MRIPIKLLVGLLYIITIHITLFIASILVFIWYMNIKYIKELYKDCNVFYISMIFHSLEKWRYNTLLDFVFDRKDYSYRYNK